MKTFYLIVLGILFLGQAYSPSHASCTCECVNGEVVPICTSSIDMEPICSPRMCPQTTPSIKPINPPRIPPIGTRDCDMVQVYNPRTRRYEWQQICK